MPPTPFPPLAFVDLETTGATVTGDRITEIGVVEVDADGVREWSQLVNPGTRIPEFIERLTGISNAMVADAPPFAAVAGEVLERLQGRLFIAHNARFDYGFLKNEFRRLGQEFRATVLCTVKLSRRLFPEHHRHSLDALVARHGLAVAGRHRALADAQLIHQFWQRLQAELPQEALSAAVAALTARPSLPAHLDADLVDELPNAAGVYFFYGENALPIYIGRASQLRKRVLSHFSADHGSAREMQLAQQVRRVDWRETLGPVGAQLLEARLVKELQPTLNRQLRRNEALCSWRLVESAAGCFVPELVSHEELAFEPGMDLFGLFKHPRDARRALQGLAEEHGLCLATLGLDPQARPGSPCFGHQMHRCRGACVGKEPLSFHSARLMAALGSLKLRAWPFAGPALLREGEGVHVIDRWRYLGTASDDGQLASLLEQGPGAFDADIYKILVKQAQRLQPIGRA
jgi:DNA polymerase-3 subunit epsilon